MDDSKYAFALAAGSHIAADTLKRLESDPERQIKKQRVVVEKLRLLRDIAPRHAPALRRSADVPRALRWAARRMDTRPYMVELAFSDPFAPYGLAYKQGDFTTALVGVGDVVGLGEPDVQSIRASQKKAVSAHKQTNWKKLVGYGVAGAAVIGLTGFIAAPAVGAALGGAAGLSGAAATGHGLALLGGGTLAAGGAGMAGGAWLVTGLGAGLGLAGGTGSQFFMQLGAATARAELIKLQVQFREAIIHNQLQMAKAQTVIQSLVEKQDELEAVLDEERLKNDSNSARLKDFEEKLAALENAIRWMRAEGQQ